MYVENQYFLGSAYSWLKDEKTNCHHTIPAEIAQKIVDKVCRTFEVRIDLKNISSKSKVAEIE